MGDDDVLVVARVTDDGARQPFLIHGLSPATGRLVRRQRLAEGTAGQLLAKEEVQAVEVQIGLIVGPPAVDAVEVEPRGTEVNQRVRVVLALQAARGIESQVVVDELAEVRVGSRDAALLGVRSVLREFLIGDHRCPERREGRLGHRVADAEVGRRQLAENAPERSAKQPGFGGQRQPSNVRSVRSNRICHFSRSLTRFTLSVC
jgi:hypothetical protein